MKLQELLNNFDPNSTDEDSVQFKDIMQWAYHDITYLTTNQIKDEFEVAATTVGRWYKGLSKPAKLIQKLVAKYFQKLLDEQNKNR